VNAPIGYPVPWDQVFGLTPYIANRRRRDINEFTKAIVERMNPPPLFEGLELLPESPRFLLVANHYQRKGLWILHSAAAVTQAVVTRYGDHPAPVRWLVTANWPRVRFGPFSLPSPGDWLLPKVAHALWCYPVSFAGTNPGFTALSLRTVLKDARAAERPIGLFPEGVAGAAGVITDPLPGVERLIFRLAKLGLPAVPCGIGEESGRFVIRFGKPVKTGEISSAGDPARLVMERVGQLL
jgi:1-acyl-sn-glycerol-3-phosphate acyltransferase